MGELYQPIYSDYSERGEEARTKLKRFSALAACISNVGRGGLFGPRLSGVPQGTAISLHNSPANPDKIQQPIPP